MPIVSVVVSVGFSLGILLFLLNISGFFMPLRANDVNGYVDFAGGQTLTFPSAIRRLEELEHETNEVALVTDATKLFHEALAHISPQDVGAHGLEYYGMRVPASENWILFLLSYLKPSTYRDYEFCHYRRAIERGTGRCGQQAMALVSYLSQRGLNTGFVALGGHAIAMAEVNGSWYLLDPDYGGVIPFSIDEAEQEPESVLPFYWSPAARKNRIDVAYAPLNEVRYGGPEARYPRACPIEYTAYALKWMVPALLMLPFAIIWVRQRIKAQTG